MSYDDWKLETPEDEQERYARLWRRSWRTADPDYLRDVYEDEKADADRGEDE